MKISTPPVLIAIALVCFVHLPKAQAVVPPPDGGYPNFATAEGTNALLHLTSGAANTGLGWSSLVNVTTGSFNTGIGAGTLALNNGDQNTATGAGALLSDTTGTGNTANAAFALFSNNTGNFNTAIGYQALFNNTTGTGNIALGASAGGQITIGSDNIDIGNPGGAESSAIRIGLNQTKAFIAGINGAPVTGTAVMVDGSGQLGVAPSSKRFKEQIKPMDNESETILALKPVTFHYKKQIDPKRTAQFGLVAEEVEKINPDLVVRDNNGAIYTVRYDVVNAMLLNEFLKEHRKVEEQGATIAQLKQDFQSRLSAQQKQIEALTAGLHKVSAQLAAASPSRGGLELSKAAPQTVLNRQ
jgi:trimeric autotransporter adhesin